MWWNRSRPISIVKLTVRTLFVQVLSTIKMFFAQTTAKHLVFGVYSFMGCYFINLYYFIYSYLWGANDPACSMLSRLLQILKNYAEFEHFTPFCTASRSLTISELYECCQCLCHLGQSLVPKSPNEMEKVKGRDPCQGQGHWSAETYSSGSVWYKETWSLMDECRLLIRLWPWERK